MPRPDIRECWAGDRLCYLGPPMPGELCPRCGNVLKAQGE